MDLEAARSGDERAFERLVAPHRHELFVHCYRMLGGIADAEDALQETLVAAWRGLASYEGRSSLRTWLYRIATNACIRLGEKRPPRMLSFDRHPAARPDDELRIEDGGWLEPWPYDAAGADPAARYSERESIELAFLAALQQLPANQRAVLILRDVLGYSAGETADLLDTSTASVNSALQRSRTTRSAPRPAAAAERRTVQAFVNAFVDRDVPALVSLLAADVRFTMPPLAGWFDGIDDVSAFFARRVFATPWRIEPFSDVSGRPAVIGYQQRDDGVYRFGSLIVLHVVDERISWVASFVDPSLVRILGVDR